MNTMRPRKFVVTPIVEILDENGDVIAEEVPPRFRQQNGAPNPAILFGCAKLADWALKFPDILEEDQRIAEVFERNAASAENGSVKELLPEVVVVPTGEAADGLDDSTKD